MKYILSDRYVIVDNEAEFLSLINENRRGRWQGPGVYSIKYEEVYPDKFGTVIWNCDDSITVTRYQKLELYQVMYILAELHAEINALEEFINQGT